MLLFVVDDEEAETLIKELFSNGRIPDNNEPNYKDLGVTSDDDMSRIAFHEMGQVLLKKNEDGCYDVDTTILGTFEVRTTNTIFLYKPSRNNLCTVHVL